MARSKRPVSPLRKQWNDEIKRERWGNHGILGGLRMCRRNLDNVRYITEVPKELQQRAERLEAEIAKLQEELEEHVEAYNKDISWRYHHITDEMLSTVQGPGKK